MSYALNQQQFESVSRLDGAKRYSHFLSRTADWENVWSLKAGSGWVSLCDDAGQRAFPVWPHSQYAAACVSAEWADAQPEAIDVHAFIAEWLPRMQAEEVRVAVFPTPAMKGVLVMPSELAQALSQELARIE
jgi:hypothetical protein